MSGSNKIGRNDPCPCGSGKKYKNCCMHLDELSGGAADPFSRYSQLISSLKLKLDHYNTSRLRKIKKEVRSQFLRFAVGNTLPRDHETLFSDWLWFDRTDEGINTPGVVYAGENGKYLEQAWSECLEALNRSYLSIYKVGAAEADFLMLEDIVSRETFRVLLQEPWIMEEKNDLLLLGRLVTMQEATIFTGMVLMLKDDAGQQEFIIKHIDYFKALLDKSDYYDFAKNHAELIYGLFDHAYQKTRLSLNDIRAINIDNQEETWLIKKFEQDEQLDFLYTTEGYKWFKPLSCAGYTRLAIGNEILLACVDLADDLPAVKAVMNSSVPEHEQQVISNLIQPPAIDKTALWFLIMKDQETEKWLHTPHKELQNKTPLEILAEENGKQHLLFMLDDFIESEDSEETQELIAYMRERVEQN